MNINKVLKLERNQYSITNEVNEKILQYCPTFPVLETSDFNIRDILLLKNVLNCIEYTLNRGNFSTGMSVSDFLKEVKAAKIAHLMAMKSLLISELSALQQQRIVVTKQSQSLQNNHYLDSTGMIDGISLGRRIMLRNTEGRNCTKDTIEEVALKLKHNAYTSPGEIAVRLYCVYGILTQAGNVMEISALLPVLDFADIDINKATSKSTAGDYVACRAVIANAIWDGNKRVVGSGDLSGLIKIIESSHVREYSMYNENTHDYVVGSAYSTADHSVFIQPEPPSSSTDGELYSPDVMFNNSLQGFNAQQVLIHYCLNQSLSCNEKINPYNNNTMLYDEFFFHKHIGG